MSNNESDRRVVSSLRPTSKSNVGNLHGVLKNWVQLQHEYDCFFFVADFHTLTTNYEESRDIEQYSFETVIECLAAGVNPGSCTIFVQSKVPEHAELLLLLSMITPLSWLESVPSYKDQKTKLNDKELDTYGFLGYPLMQAADTLIYRAGKVPVDAGQVTHIELTREVARRFNHIYGREEGFEEQAVSAIKLMGRKAGKLYRELRKLYLEHGDSEALLKARALLEEQQSLSIGDQERLYGYLEGSGRIILPEPEPIYLESNDLDQEEIIDRSKHFEEDPDLVHSIIQEGSKKARMAARETLEEVKDAIGISHR